MSGEPTLLECFRRIADYCEENSVEVSVRNEMFAIFVEHLQAKVAELSKAGVSGSPVQPKLDEFAQARTDVHSLAQMKALAEKNHIGLLERFMAPYHDARNHFVIAIDAFKGWSGWGKAVVAGVVSALIFSIIAWVFFCAGRDIWVDLEKQFHGVKSGVDLERK